MGLQQLKENREGLLSSEWSNELDGNREGSTDQRGFDRVEVRPRSLHGLNNHCRARSNIV